MVDFELAKEWLKPYAAKWQVLNRGEWKYAFHEKTLVRYLEEIEMREDLIENVLAYLKSDECIADLSLYDQKIAATWKPTRAWLEVSNKAVGNIKGVRLYHALIDASAQSGQGDGAYLIENGCAYKVSHTFFFNQPNPPTNADMEGKYKSISGISYQVGSLGVNPDTGLWNYVIEKRERVQQDIAKYTTAKTIFEQQEEEVHHGVKQDKVESTGKAAGVNNGVITHRKLSKNADCTTDVHNTYETEIEVKGASESVTVTRTGSTIETTNRSVSSPLPADNLKVGESVTNTKTPGGKWNTVYRKHVKNALNWISEACSKTIFSHSHSKTTNQATDPGFTHAEEAANGVIAKKSVRAEEDGSFTINEDTETELPVKDAEKTVRKTLRGIEERVTHRNQKAADIPDAKDLGIGESLSISKTNGGLFNVAIQKLIVQPIGKIRETCSKTIFAHSHSKVTIQGDDPGFTHTEEAANGKVVRKEVARNEDGTFSVTESEEKEVAVEDAAVTERVTLGGTEVREEHRNLTTKPSAANLKVGESLTVSKTPGGLWNAVKTKFVAKAIDKIRESCSQNLFSHTHSSTKIVTEDPGFEHSEDFSGGVITRKEVGDNGNGTWTITTTTEEARAVTTASKEVRRTLRGVHTSSVDENQEEGFSEEQIEGLGVGQSLRQEKNPSGKFRKSSSSVTPKAVDDLAGSFEENEFAKIETTHKTVLTKPTFTTEGSGAGEEEGDAGPETDGDISAPGTETPLISTRWNKNEEGSFDEVVTKEIPKPYNSGWMEWESTNITPAGKQTYKHGVLIFYNQTKIPKPKGSSVLINVHPNKFGLFDGSISYNDLKSWTSNSGGGVFGGSQTGTIDYYEQYKTSFGDLRRRDMEVDVIKFYGRGNEGTEASYIVNQKAIPGLKLPERTYATGNPTVVKDWYTVDTGGGSTAT